MSSSNVTFDSTSRAMDALSTVPDNPVVRSQKEYVAAGQAIQASTGMPPLSDFFTSQTEQVAPQGLSVAAVSSSQPTFIQQFVQDIKLLKTPAAEAPAPVANHVDVFA